MKAHAASVAVLALVVGARAAAAPSAPAVAKAGGGQASLAVGFDAKGELRAAVCDKEPCNVSAGVALGAPAGAASSYKARFAIVGIGAGRRVIVATLKGDRPSKTFEAVVAAPLSGSAPLVLFAGLTGLAEGEDGVRHGGMVVVAGPDETGARSVAVGEAHEDVTICGRPTILGPRQLDARDLTLKPAKVQRLDAEERVGAPRLTAERVADGTPLGPTLLHATGASSAIGNPAALTDGNVETTWAENRGGSGKGEFVVMNAPGELSVEGLDLSVRPGLQGGPRPPLPDAVPPHAVSPKELWLATSKQLFNVTLPEDAWTHPGARYRVRFPSPIKDDCLAVVLDSAFDEKPDAAVTLAEVTVVTSLGSVNLLELVAALAGGGPKAQSAKVVLRSLGQPAFEAVAAGFAKLDEGGRRAALEVLDGAPCATSAPAYVEAFLGPVEAHRIHARDHLPRCGAEAAPLLAARLPASHGRELTTLSDALADMAPAAAVGLFVPLMEEPAAERRAALRAALGRLAGRPQAAASLRQVLADPATPQVALLDVLRGIGARARELMPESAVALSHLAPPEASLRLRYLRIGPSAELAAAVPNARQLLEQAMTVDPDPHVRAAAINATNDARLFQPALLRGLSDADPRVRMAAAHGLVSAADASATPALLGTLKSDRWPAVRALAAEALGASPVSMATDQKLVAAVDDESWVVKRAALNALGARNARAQSQVVLERLDDEEEWPAVRLAAARALGSLCYEPALRSLTEHARTLADPMASMDSRGIGYAALGALRDLAPSDLAARLHPLLDVHAPAGARAAANAALHERSPRCRTRS